MTPLNFYHGERQTGRDRRETETGERRESEREIEKERGPATRISNRKLKARETWPEERFL